MKGNKTVNYIVIGVLSAILVISLALSIHFGILVNSTYRQAHWILGEIFNAVAFVSIGLIIGILLYDKRYKYELYISIAMLMAALTIILVIYLSPSIFNSNKGLYNYTADHLRTKLMPILYIISGISIIGIIKNVLPIIKKLIRK